MRVHLSRSLTEKRCRERHDWRPLHVDGGCNGVRPATAAPAVSAAVRVDSQTRTPIGRNMPQPWFTHVGLTSWRHSTLHTTLLAASAVRLQSVRFRGTVCEGAIWDGADV